jgi:hypothetical protein
MFLLDVASHFVDIKTGDHFHPKVIDESENLEEVLTCNLN